MYAIVTNVRVENPEEARLRLPEAREALVSRAPGIVGGYWLEPIEGIGTSVLVFETKEYAEEAAEISGASNARRYVARPDCP